MFRVRFWDGKRKIDPIFRKQVEGGEKPGAQDRIQASLIKLLREQRMVCVGQDAEGFDLYDRDPNPPTKRARKVRPCSRCGHVEGA